MSASDKKKLRKAQQTEQLTARQRQEQAEAKKLKIYTIAFVAVIALVAVFAIGKLIYQTYTNSGWAEKHTIAATVNGQNINSVEMNYYYQDAIGKLYEDAYNNFSSYYELYFEAIGLDLTKPLNEQTNAAVNKTWAEYFLDAALEQAKFDYTFAAKAAEANFTLPAEAQADIDAQIATAESNATLRGFTKADNYLRQLYCNGATIESYREYLVRSALAEAYCEHYYNNVTVEQADIDKHAAEHKDDYNSYDYSYVYVTYESFLEEGVESADATTEQKDAAAVEAKKLAEELAALENLDAIRDKVNEIEATEITVKDVTAQLHTAVSNANIANWLAAEERQAGEITLLSNAKEDDPTPYGFYVLCFGKKNDNSRKMNNVRHLLVAFEGGEEDEISGEMVYTAEAMEAARAEAEELLQQWRDGEATEESFAKLVSEKTDDTASAERGGLYEDIHPASEYVANFLAWSVDPERQIGDVAIVESEYGCHIMYFSGYSDRSYRDMVISDELKGTKYEQWYDDTMAAATAVIANTSKIPLNEPIAG